MSFYHLKKEKKKTKHMFEHGIWMRRENNLVSYVALSTDSSDLGSATCHWGWMARWIIDNIQVDPIVWYNDSFFFVWNIDHKTFMYQWL